MKLAFILCLLMAANILWLGILSELRQRGYKVSYVNFLADLKSYHALIVDTKEPHSRHKLTFILILIYLIVAVVAASLVIL